MYADRVACCPLVSHVEYAPRALFRSEKDAARPIIIRKKRHRQTDGRTPDRNIMHSDRRGQRHNLTARAVNPEKFIISGILVTNFVTISRPT